MVQIWEICDLEVSGVNEYPENHVPRHLHMAACYGG